MKTSIGQSFNIMVIALLLFLFSGVFILLGNQSRVQAVITDGSNAVNMVGQYDTDGTPLYTKGGGYGSDGFGINNSLNDYGMNEPEAVIMDETNNRLYVADAGNNRVLIFNLDGSNNPIDYKADYVIGQSDLTSYDQNGCTQSVFRTMGDIALDITNNRLFVVGTRRVLVFDTSNLANGMNASNVLGQADFETCDSQIGAANTLSTPDGLTYDSENNYLFVADSDYHRVTVFDLSSGITDNMDASYAIGQADLTTTTAPASTSQTSLSAPKTVYYDTTNDRLYIYDSGHGRMIIHTFTGPSPLSTGRAADNVLGSSEFNLTDGLTADGIAVDAGNNKLYICTNGLAGSDNCKVYDVSTIDNGEAVETQFTIRTDNGGNQQGQNSLYYNSTQQYLYVANMRRNRVGVYDLSAIADTETPVDAIGHLDSAGDPIFGETGPFEPQGGPNHNSFNIEETGIRGPDIAVDSTNKRLFVGDRKNRRILIFNLDANNQLVDYTADGILGAGSFYNRSDMMAASDSNFLYPEGIEYDSINNYLYVADGSWNRVLVFNVSTIDNGESAAFVLGQPDFTSTDAATTQTGMDTPTSLAFDPTQKYLYVADSGNKRVLVYNVSDGLDVEEEAMNVIGQSGFATSAGGTTSVLFGDDGTGNAISGITYDSTNDYLYVSDLGNARIMVFDVSGGVTNSMAASYVLGASDFVTQGGDISQSAFRDLGGLDFDPTNERLFVAGATDDRVLVFSTANISNGMNASYVLGQSSFTDDTAATTQGGLNMPIDVAYNSGSDRLFVMDKKNNRVMVFDVEPGPPAAPTICVISSLATTTLTVGWTDNASDETDFSLEQSTNGTDYSEINRPAANVTSYDASSLDSNTQYWYRIKSSNAQGDSAYATCNAVSTRSTPPATPTLIDPTDAPEELVSLNPTFTFSTTFTDGDAVKFRLEMSTNSSFLRTDLAFDQRDNNTGWSDTFYTSGESAIYMLPTTESLTSGTTYYWRVRAYGSGGESSISATYSFNTKISSAEEDDDIAFVDDINSKANFDYANSTIHWDEDGYASIPASLSWNSAGEFGPKSEDTKKIIVFDANGDGYLDKLEFNIANEIGSYIHVNDGDGTFTTDAYNFGNAYNDMEVGDLDGDGDMDIAKVSSIWANFADINSGNATFTLSDSDAFGNLNTCVALGDLDKDGDIDFVGCASGTGVNSASYNNGSGTFTDNDTLWGGTSDASADLEIADFNGDGWGDVLVANRDEQSLIYLNDKDGTFTRSNALGAGAVPAFSLTVGDIDNDGDLDAIEASDIYFNDGEGSFTVSPYDSQTLGVNKDTELFDIDLDGDLDILIANSSGASYRLNNGLGIFATAVSLYSVGEVQSVSAGQFSGNPIVEVQIGIDGANKLISQNVYELGYDGTEIDYRVLAVFDSDNDGDQDLLSLDVAGNGTLALQVNDGSQSYTESEIIFSGEFYPDEVGTPVIADLNGDTYLDIIFPYEQDDDAVGEDIDPILINNGSNGFTISSAEFGSDGHEGIKAADFDLDGDMDVIAYTEGESPELYSNNGSGSYSFDSSANGNTLYSGDAFIVDVDSDGDDDVIYHMTDYYLILKNDGTGNFDTNESIDSVHGYMTVVDLNGDNYPEIVTGSTDTFDIYPNNQGTISSTNLMTSIDCYINDLTYADVDADGDTDIIFGCGISWEGDAEANLIGLNYGNFNFAIVSMMNTPDLSKESIFVAGDYDSDGDLDLFLHNDEWDTSGEEDVFEGSHIRYDLHNQHTTSTDYNLLSNTGLDSTADDITTATLTAIDNAGGETINYYLAATNAITATWNTLDAGETNNIMAFNTTVGVPVYVTNEGTSKFTMDGIIWSSASGLSTGINDFWSAGASVAVGDSGQIYELNTSGDPVWEQVCVGGSENLYAIQGYNAGQGDGTLYAVGANGTALIITSDDGDVVSCVSLDTGQSDNLNEAYNSDGTDPMIAGDSGLIIVSENSGASWSQDTTNTTENLNAIYGMNDDETQIAVGDNGTIIKISGDESEWTVISSGTSENLNAVHSLNEDGDLDVWVVGDNGTILYSDDEGDTWTDYAPSGLSVNMNDIHLYDDSGDTLVYAAGGTGTARQFVSYSSAPTWEGPVTSGSEWTFTASGSSLAWKAVMSTTSEITPTILDRISISYSTAEDSNSTPSVYVPPPPTAPSTNTPEALSTSSIEWSFSDSSNNETGFKLYDQDLLILETGTTPDISSFVETGLLPNTEYIRHVSAYNSDGDSSLVSFIPTYTFANVPAIETLTVSSGTSINLSIYTNDNPSSTEYAIYEGSSQDWLQANGTIGSARVYQTYAAWLNGQSAISITGLTNNAMYAFGVMARNGDDIETDISDIENIIVYRPANANLVLTKIVGINESDEMVGIYFGQPVYANSEVGQQVENIPFYEQLANFYITIALGLIILCLTLLLLNAKLKLGHLKHVHKVVLTDWHGRNSDHFFHLFHGENTEKQGKNYTNHHHLYKFTSIGMLSLVLGIALKVIIILSTVALVYGGVSVNAFENDSGADVYQNDVLTYQLTYLNNGAETATNVVISDAIPLKTTFVEDSLSGTDNCTVIAYEVYCELGSIASNETGNIEFRVLVGGVEGDTIINSATVSYDQGAETVNSNSVTNDIISNIDPDLIGAGETLEATLIEGWNYFKLAETAKVQFAHRSGTHAVELTDADLVGDAASLRITSDPINAAISTGDSAQVDSDGNGVNDLGLKVQSIEDDEIATIGIASVEEPIEDGPVCGDAVCNGDESCSSCTVDCGICELVECGNGVCSEQEGCQTCPEDCGPCIAQAACSDGADNDGDGLTDYPYDLGCSDPYDNNEDNETVCGNSLCEVDESCNDCVQDCGICEIPPLMNCGTGICEGNEDCQTCPEDCGPCIEPAACSDGFDNDLDGLIDYPNDLGCSDPNDNNEDNKTVCGNDLCEGDESCITCREDCGICTTSGPFCGDNKCSNEETCSSCANDCGVCEEIIESVITKVTGGKIKDKEVLIIIDILENKEEYEKTDKEREFDLLIGTEKIAQALNLDDNLKGVVKGALKVKQITLDNKIVEKINDVVEEPVVAATAVTSIAAVATVGATGATGASVLTYLQFLITTPLGLFSRRKRKGWGIIYNSITKKPLDLAIVRLYNSVTKKLIRTKVTDKLGRYQFIVKPGMYYIEVGKKEYAFPSKLLDNQETDGEYLNVYYGGDIQITEDGAINQPIAVDPDKKDLSNSAVIKRFVLRRVQTVFTLLGPILALVSLIISPSWWIFGLLVAQIVMLVVFRRLATGQKPTSFGTVMDKLRKHPLGRAVVRVFDTKFHKLLDTRITNGKGKYAFLVGNDVYYMTSEKNGYHPHRTDKVDLTSEESGYLAEDIRMTPAGMKLEQGQEHAVAVRSTVGRQEEKQVNGVQKVVRREEESFKGDIKDVKLDDMHEEYYDVDVLKKN